MGQISKRGLGRGFETLLPTNFDKSLVLNDDERIQKISINDIQPNKDQPRRHFDEVALSELANSIKTHGVLLPLVVTQLQKEPSKYLIVAGERRWRAAKQAGLHKVPVVIRSLKALEQLEVSLIENVQRVDLSSLEQAVTIKSWHEQFSVSYEEIASRVGKATSTVNNIVRLLNLPPKAEQALRLKKITEGHARAILALKNNTKAQEELLKFIENYGWSVRQAERYVLSHKQGIASSEASKARVETETPQTKALSKKLGVPVRLKRMAKGGRLEINFTNDQQLTDIINRL